MADDMTMEQNRKPGINWFVINVPTTLAFLTLLGLVVAWNDSLARELERMDARLDTIESSRTANIAANDKRWDAMTALVTAIGAQSNKSEYRLTVAEQGIVAVGQRQDRFADALGDLRDGMASIKTSIDLLTQRVETAIPMKKSEIDSPPPELASSP